MPTYSYRCTECSTAFDIQQAFTDDTLTDCPKCGGKLRKLFSAVGVSFKGPGFYRTDSRAPRGSDGSHSPSTSSSSSASTPASSSSDSGSSSSAAASTSSSSSSSSDGGSKSSAGGSAKPSEKKSSSPAPAAK